MQPSEAKSSPLVIGADVCAVRRVTEVVNHAQMARAFENATVMADGRDGHFSIRWCMRYGRRLLQRPNHLLLGAWPNGPPCRPFTLASAAQRLNHSPINIVA